MGVSLSGAGFGCWRDRSHRGKAPWRLIQALLKCSREEALRQSGVGGSTPVPENFGERLRGLFSSPSSAPVQAPLQFPAQIRPITRQGSGAAFLSYLTDRGFPRSRVDEVAHDYGLRYAVSGPFRQRLVIPIVMPQGLVNWTARAITPATVRYKTLSDDPDKAKDQGLPVAPLAVDHTLWNYAELIETKGRRLAVVEGPLDALKSDFFAQDYDTRVTCTFGKNISESQIALLSNLRDNFDEFWLVQDPDALLGSMSAQRRLAFLDFRFKRIPQGVEDPGALTESQARAFFR